MKCFSAIKEDESQDNNNKSNIKNVKLKDDKFNGVKRIQINNINNNFNFYNYNKIIYYNSYINLINAIGQNKNVNSIKNKDIIIQPHEIKTINNTISPKKDKDNLNHEDYIIKMFGKFGWICSICNNFNFESRCICNRCKAVKAPKTKEEIEEQKKEIKEKKAINKKKKKIKENNKV